MVCLNPSRCKNSVVILSQPFGLAVAHNSERTCYIDEEHRAHKFLHQHLLQVQI